MEDDIRDDMCMKVCIGARLFFSMIVFSAGYPRGNYAKPCTARASPTLLPFDALLERLPFIMENRKAGQLTRDPGALWLPVKV